jgi:hypothetical protein
MSDPKKSWRAVGVAVQGLSHSKADLPCQDTVDWRHTASGELIAAVADGAGSARFSERGARLACEAALVFLENNLPKQLDPASSKILCEAVLAESRKAILQEAEDGNFLAREMACTLLILILGKNFAAAAQIGDGAIILRNANGELFAFTTPPSAEYLNETTFLTADDALQNAQFAFQPGPITGAVMFTDGLQMLALKLPDATPHPGFFKPLFNYLETENNMSRAKDQLQSFLTSPKIIQRADDDLTLFFALTQEKT